MSEFDLSCLEDKDKVESLKIDIKLLNEEIKTLKNNFLILKSIYIYYKIWYNVFTRCKGDIYDFRF